MCFLGLLENYLQAVEWGLNGIHVLRPVECQLKVMNIQGYQALAKQQKMLKKFENSSTKSRGTIHELVDTVRIIWGVCHVILT
jgi:hypothetical protein